LHHKPTRQDENPLCADSEAGNISLRVITLAGEAKTKIEKLSTKRLDYYGPGTPADLREALLSGAARKTFFSISPPRTDHARSPRRGPRQAETDTGGRYGYQ
jgi:hypothetical protein